MREIENEGNKKEVERLEKINREQKESKEAELQAKIRDLKQKNEEKKEADGELFDTKAKTSGEFMKEGISDVGNALYGVAKGVVGFSKVISAPVIGIIEVFRK